MSSYSKMFDLCGHFSHGYISIMVRRRDNNGGSIGDNTEDNPSK